MNRLTIFLIFLIISGGRICNGQTLQPDSCGLDTVSVLNKYEIAFIDSTLLGKIQDSTNMFDLKEKRLAFYSCTHNVNDNGIMTKDIFFKMIKPIYRGPRGLIVLNDKEKTETGGYDAIVIINCKAEKREDIIKNLKIK